MVWLTDRKWSVPRAMRLITYEFAFKHRNVFVWMNARLEPQMWRTICSAPERQCKFSDAFVGSAVSGYPLKGPGKGAPQAGP